MNKRFSLKSTISLLTLAVLMGAPLSAKGSDLIDHETGNINNSNHTVPAAQPDLRRVHTDCLANYVIPHLDAYSAVWVARASFHSRGKNPLPVPPHVTHTIDSIRAGQLRTARGIALQDLQEFNQHWRSIEACRERLSDPNLDAKTHSIVMALGFDLFKRISNSNKQFQWTCHFVHRLGEDRVQIYSASKPFFKVGMSEVDGGFILNSVKSLGVDRDAVLTAMSPFFTKEMSMREISSCLNRCKNHVTTMQLATQYDLLPVGEEGREPSWHVERCFNLIDSLGAQKEAVSAACGALATEEQSGYQVMKQLRQYEHLGEHTDASTLFLIAAYGFHTKMPKTTDFLKIPNLYGGLQKIKKENRPAFCQELDQIEKEGPDRQIGDDFSYYVELGDDPLELIQDARACGLLHERFNGHALLMMLRATAAHFGKNPEKCHNIMSEMKGLVQEKENYDRITAFFDFLSQLPDAEAALKRVKNHPQFSKDLDLSEISWLMEHSAG